MTGNLLDGFPIYRPQTAGGRFIQTADLDECCGHFGPTPDFPDDVYHYRLTTPDAPHSIDCYQGEGDAALTKAMGGPGDPPDFAAIAEKLGVTQHALLDALWAQRSPNLEAAAAGFGISIRALHRAIGPPTGLWRAGLVPNGRLTHAFGTPLQLATRL